MLSSTVQESEQLLKRFALNIHVIVSIITGSLNSCYPVTEQMTTGITRNF